MSQVILEISDFFKYCFVNPGMIIGYLNQFFTTRLNSMQYIEEYRHGFLFVFKDFDSFKIRAQPLMAKDLAEPSISQQEDSFFTKFFVPQEQFPENGIDLEIKVVEGDKTKVIPFLESFIHSVSPAIEISKDEEQNLNFNIPKYEIIQKYANSLMRRFYLTSDK
jgi:hypothetical protein